MGIGVEGLEFFRPQHAHVSLVGDHGVGFEEVVMELLEQGLGHGGLHNGVDLYVAAFKHVGDAVALVSTAANVKGGVPVGAALAKQFDDTLLQYRFADDGDEFHGMQVHGGSGVEEFGEFKVKRDADSDVEGKGDRQCPGERVGWIGVR